MNVPKYSCPICHRKNWQIRFMLYKNAISISCSKCDYQATIGLSISAVPRKEIEVTT